MMPQRKPGMNVQAFLDGNFTRHRSNCQMAFNNKIVVGDFENGNIYAFDLDDFSDNGSIQKWLRSWRALPTGQNNLKRTTQHMMQLDCESGVGLNGSMIAETIYLQTEDGDYLITESGDYLISDDTTPITQGAILKLCCVGQMMVATHGQTSIGHPWAKLASITNV
jgi:hypothetical protein